MPDVGEIDKTSEGTLKSFIAGDVMPFEKKFKHPFTARPTARIMLATNNVPNFSDKSDGIWRHLLLLPLTVQIPEEEKVPGMLEPGWWRERGELPGILNWALDGLRRLRSRGRFTQPDECKDAAEAHRRDCNPARRFLLEHYEEGDPGNDQVVKATLYNQYVAWCAANGYRHPNASNTFGKEVKRAFKEAKDGKDRAKDSSGPNRENVYKGIRPRADLDEGGEVPF
jgi:P4 family phage/plasmid primase-like protien